MSSSSAGPLLRTYRSSWTRIAGWFVVLCAVLAVVDAVFRATAGARLGTSLLACGAALLAFVWALRPEVFERSDALEVRNPLRTGVLPWSSVTDVTGADVVTVTATGAAGPVVVRCFAMPRKMGPRARQATLGGVSVPASAPGAVPSPPEDPVGRFESLAATLGSSGAHGTASYAVSPIAAIALAAGLLLVVVGGVLMAAS